MPELEPTTRAAIHVDDACRVVAVGDQAARWLGLRPGDGPLDALLDGEGAAELVRAGAGERVVVVTPVRDRAQSRSVACWSERGVDHVVVHCVDVSELHRRALDGDRLYEATGDIVFTFRDEHFTRVSPSFWSALNMTEEELLATPVFALIHPDDHEASSAAAADLLEGRAEMIHVENRYKCKGGGYRTMQWTVGFDVANETMFGVARDVTDDIRVRTELRRTRDAAQAANRAKDTFVASMSHELRTPLSAILGYSEMLLEEANDEATARDLECIRQAGEQLLSLINGVLDLSKMEAGQVDIFIETVPVDELVEAAEATVAPLAQRNRNAFEVSLQAGGVVQTDRRKLHQVLVNLLSNAAKFTSDGAVQLRVDGDDEAVTFSVRDTGIGIAPDEMERIFVPFEQASAEVNRRYGGTGLGLALAKRFCDLIGCTLSAESAPGDGSTFTVRVPRHRPRDARSVEVTGGYLVLVDS